MRYQLFVRWGKNEEGRQDHNADTVEVRLDGKIVQQHAFSNNGDLVHGYCIGVIDTLKRLGAEAELPQCLSGHLCADKSRED